MSFFKKLFGQSGQTESKTRQTWDLKVMTIDRLTSSAVKVVFEVPVEAKSLFEFIPGQYLNLRFEIDGKTVQRSYSICSGINEALAIGVKQVEGGVVSSYINTKLKEGDVIKVDVPRGNFRLTDAGGDYLAFAAGSGITPILSMLKAVHDSQQGRIQLCFGNKNPEQTMFRADVQSLCNNENLKVDFIYSQHGETMQRVDGEYVKQLVKADIELLKKDGYFICGPEQMIVEVSEALKLFGVSEDKIHFELFTTPTIIESKTTRTESFNGVAQVDVILDGEKVNFELATDGPRILDVLDDAGIDAPYSCRGGVCCTCRAKVLEGSATMDHNMSLTDKEIAEGYILTCQAHPTSEKLTISFDE